MRRVGGARRKGSEWWNNEVEAVVREKKRAYKEWLQRQNDESYERYRVKRMKTKKAVREAKRNADMRWGRRVSENFERNRKMFWKEVKRMSCCESRSEERVKGRNGEGLEDEESVRNRWAEYFEDLLNVNDGREMNENEEVNVQVFGRIAVNESEITAEEVQRVINGMKPGKSPGLDGCAVECLKQGGIEIVEWLARIFNIYLTEGVVPLDWYPCIKGKSPERCARSTEELVSYVSWGKCMEGY